ncbi:uncharacterized protein METZ01_LOCUS188727 [marine metagenome]|uniref:Hemerythrin-like domain-containing protein n=1 Tax=marine metagenome TaxID=408172 RepID=A0A382DE00_9ZZZZ
MKISEYLILDHRAVARIVSDLEKLLDVESTDTKELQGEVAKLQLALEDHARFEEHVLFPRLEHNLGSNEGPLAVMEAEHSLISALFGQIESSRGGKIATLTRTLTSLLIRHFIKEEQDLFPIADKLLGDVEIDEFRNNLLLPSGLTKK